MISLAGSGRKASGPTKNVSLVPLVLDVGLPASGAGESVLALPLGWGSFMSVLLAELSRHCSTRVTIVSGSGRFQDVPGWKTEWSRRVRVVSWDELGDITARCEAADQLLLVEPRFWPVGRVDLRSLLKRSRSFRGAVHLVPLGGLQSRTRERVEYDQDGRIRRVQRIYPEVSWPRAAAERVFCTIMPAQCLDGRVARSLSALRSSLAAGGMLSQDLPYAGEVFDLLDPSGVIAVNERLLGPAAGAAPRGYTVRSRGIWVGSGCSIDPSARLTGPLVIQENVRIEKDARVIGPAVVGAGARLAPGATLVRGVMGFGAVLPAHRTACEQVVSRSARAADHAAAGPRFDDPSWKTGPGAAFPPEDDDRDPDPASATRGRWFAEAVKRLMDLVGASLGLLLLSPLMLMIALLIKLTSTGPVFFAHRREGRGGVEFPCLKFRTMVADAHQRQRELYARNLVDGPQFKLDHDPRETRFGRWLRATNLDELPQLLNVLAGQMSLVGPRPSPFRENQICLPWRNARLSVRPGITGLWQLCRDGRSAGDFHQWIFYDLTYVRCASPGLDLRILLNTLLSAGGRWRVPLSRLVRASQVPVTGHDNPKLRTAEAPTAGAPAQARSEHEPSA